MTIVWIGVDPPWSRQRAAGTPLRTPGVVLVLACASLASAALAGLGLGLVVMGVLYGL
jgi:hypothetical protein